MDTGLCCVPDCDGKVCGDDGCGGECQPGCAAEEVCSPDSSACNTPVPCLNPIPESWTFLGDDITLTECTPIAEILANQEYYNEREVRIEGEVAAVCSSGQCWMDVRDGEGNVIKIKGEEGFFHVEATGQSTVIQGVFQRTNAWIWTEAMAYGALQ